MATPRNSTPIEEKKEQSQFKEYLVIGCGQDNRHSHRHPAERWMSIDIDRSVKPTLVLSIDTLMPENLPGKFKIILMEFLSGAVSEERLRIVSAFLQEQGALFIMPSSEKMIEEAPPIFEMFLMASNQLLMLRDRSEFDSLIKVLKSDISDKFDGTFTLLTSEIARLNKIESYKKLDPLLMSVLAHIHTYKQHRDSVKLKNFFKNSDYEELVKDLNDAIFRLNEGKLDVGTVIKKMDEWAVKLPSTTAALHNINYDPLSHVLDICKKGLLYYQRKKEFTASVEHKGEPRIGSGPGK